MLVLAVEGSTSRASIAIKNDSHLIYEESSDNPKTHSEFLNSAIERGLQKSRLDLSQIDVFACTQGPGSFTGIRVASNIIKSFCMLFQKPMYTTDSLHLLAESAFKKSPLPIQILCLINAHKNMVYAGVFEKHQVVLEPCSLKINELAGLKSVKQALGLGDGFRVYNSSLGDLSSDLYIRDQSYSDFPDSKTLCDLALKAFEQGKTIEWNLYKPLYIRDSEAEEVLKLKAK